MIYFTIFMIITWLLIEAYFWFAMSASLGIRWRKRLLPLQLLSMAVIATFFIMVLLHEYPRSQSTIGTNLVQGISTSLLIAKFFAVIFFFAEDIIRIPFGIAGRVFGTRKKLIPGRRNFIRRVSLTAAALPFTGLLYGIIKGKYDFKLHQITLHFPDLPAAFDGFRIAQLSDVHSGSFDNKEAVAKGLDIVREQRADLVLFTGDMVNYRAEEGDPYIGMFQKIEAPYGKYSVLGNHDYGNYNNGVLDNDRKRENHRNLHQLEADMGFQLLNNENVRIEKDGASIRLVGVENWGHLPFPQRGDLDKALADVQDDEFTVLMSHDPTHWEEKTLAHKKQVHLTLSGHTHGAQMGVEIPWLKWSPAQFVYKRWAGLYREGKEYLYVNRGFGFIGYPGRAGIWPEITVIELKRGSSKA